MRQSLNVFVINLFSQYFPVRSFVPFARSCDVFVVFLLLFNFSFEFEFARQMAEGFYSHRNAHTTILSSFLLLSLSPSPFLFLYLYSLISSHSFCSLSIFRLHIVTMHGKRRYEKEITFGKIFSAHKSLRIIYDMVHNDDEDDDDGDEKR